MAAGWPNPTPSCSISPKARAFCPRTDTSAALAYQWLFFEQYSHEPYIAVRKALLTFPDAPRGDAGAAGRDAGRRRQGAGVMEDIWSTRLLRRQRDSASPTSRSTPIRMTRPSTAERRPGGGWLDRVEADPGHVPLGSRRRLAQLPEKRQRFSVPELRKNKDLEQKGCRSGNLRAGRLRRCQEGREPSPGRPVGPASAREGRDGMADKLKHGRRVAWETQPGQNPGKVIKSRPPKPRSRPTRSAASKGRPPVHRGERKIRQAGRPQAGRAEEALLGPSCPRLSGRAAVAP